LKRKKTVLIVEDDLFSAEYLKKMLTKENFDILGIVDTGEDAIKICERINPDIILMDVILKGALSGAEAAVTIRQLHNSCKIIFLTAYAEAEMVDYASKAQACSYLMKPYRRKEILATIEVALSQEYIQQKTEKQINLISLKNNFFFDIKQKHLYKNDQEIPLSSQKIKLLELLIKNKNITVSNEQISLYVWGELKSNSTLRSLIYRFKSIINDDIITNVNGIGYKINLSS